MLISFLHCKPSFKCFTHLIFKTLWSRDYYFPHFTDKEIEAQRKAQWYSINDHQLWNSSHRLEHQDSNASVFQPPAMLELLSQYAALNLDKIHKQMVFRHRITGNKIMWSPRQEGSSRWDLHPDMGFRPGTVSSPQTRSRSQPRDWGPMEGRGGEQRVRLPKGPGLSAGLPARSGDKLVLLPRLIHIVQPQSKSQDAFPKLVNGF